MGRMLQTVLAVVFLSGCASKMCEGTASCAGTVTAGLNVSKLPEVQRVRLCVDETCTDAPPRPNGQGQGLYITPPGTDALGTIVNARVEFIDGQGKVINAFTGQGTVKQDCHCRRANFTVDLKRGTLREDD